MNPITVIIPTWSNYSYLTRTIKSLVELTVEADYRLLVVDNGSEKETAEFLKEHSIPSIRNEVNLGFIRATNQGMREVPDGHDVLLLNDDVQIVDPYWLARLQSRLNGDIGAVGPVSNFVMGVQGFHILKDLPLLHEVKFLIGFCCLIRADAFRAVGEMDDRFGMGGNDDLDYSIRLAEAGFKMAVDRSVFVFHYGAKSINRIGGYEEVEPKTRAQLVEKWSKERVLALFEQSWPAIKRLEEEEAA